MFSVFLPLAKANVSLLTCLTSLKSTSDDIATYPSATFCVYSSSGDAPVPDNTIAFVVAKASTPTSKPIKLDALYLSAFRGDPNGHWNGYEIKEDFGKRRPEAGSFRVSDFVKRRPEAGSFRSLGMNEGKIGGYMIPGAEEGSSIYQQESLQN
ncbi:hypothetical protein B0H13DRAFT_1884579 [Mycena leptocephala]|nr:hypothetical protein B0H13DRAFT_1884579 [Mycena leptocephala]